MPLLLAAAGLGLGVGLGIRGVGARDGDGPASRPCPGFPLSRERRCGWWEWGELLVV